MRRVWRKAKLTGKGQTTLPRKVRACLCLKPGDKLRYLFVGEEVRLMNAPSIIEMKKILRKARSAAGLS